MVIYKAEKIEEELVKPGLKRKVVTGKNLMLVLYEIEPGTEFPEHSHPHEQMGYVIEGEAEFKIGNEKAVIKTGDIFHVPSNVPHCAKVVGGKRLVELDIFHPIREDYLKKTK